MKRIFTLLLLVLAVLSIGAQNLPFTGCATDLLRKKHPELWLAQMRNDRAAYQAFRNHPDGPQAIQALRTLPVVVHVIHNNGPENISDAQVQQAIAQLNAAFNATFGTGVNTDLQFCLAQRDPQGQATSGITRNQSALTSMDLETQDLALKDLNRWAPTCYINIWVVASISSLSSGDGVVGYAYLPSAHGQNVDGIVVEADYFGSSQTNTGVLVHEMGHYLGLYHTFEGGCGNNDCLQDGDQVCDTPPDQTTFSSCNPNANSCNTDADDASTNNPFTTDVPDLGEDYMDYSDLSCFSKFTPGQSERMNWHVTHVRSSLLACLSCQTPCPAPVTAAITTPAAAQTITVGASLNFSATATNSTQVAWNVGMDPAFSTSLNASYTFNTVGVFWVKFRAASDNPEQCLAVSDSVQVTVKCNAQAVFSVPPVIVNGLAVTFTNNSLQATGYEWFLDNVSISMSANLTHTFVNTGVYQLCLRASNANCAATLCTTVYVESNGAAAAGCDNTFIQSLAGMGGSQPNIFPHPNGDFFATGLRNDSTVIVRFNQGGFPLWSRAFQLDPNDVLQIRHLFVDASGDLIGVTSPEILSVGDARSTAFRYNLTSNTFVWVQHLPGVAYSHIHAVGTDQCVLTGTMNQGLTQLTLINKNTGSINGYNLQGEQGDFLSTVYNGTLYGTCRRYYSASGDFRASVFAHDLNTGAFQWQNSIISRGNTSGSTETRMYPETPIVDNNNLVIIASGDLAGFNVYNTGPVELVVAKTSLTGDVLWTKQYIMGAGDRPKATAVVATATGYYLVGNLYSTQLGNFNFGFIAKIDKQGQVEWAKRLGIFGKNIVRNVMERNGYVYLTMASDSYAPDDLLLIKLDQEGNTNSTCDFVQPMEVSVVELVNIQDQRNYGVNGAGPTPEAWNVVSAATSLTTTTYCNTPCICPEIPISAGVDTTICSGQSVGLQATPGFEIYTWSPTTGLNNPNIANPIATPLTTTTYTVDATKIGVELIQNGDFSQGTTGFTSEYIYGDQGYGHYWVTNDPLLYNSQWTIPVDHSPSADNMMMLFDGDNLGNFPFLWRQSLLVEPGSEHVFQLWGAMAYFAAPPSIEVKVNGIPVDTFVLLGGNSQVGVWQPFSLTIPANGATQLDIVLTDLSTVSTGNDFALDDISLRKICHYTDSVTIRTGVGIAPTLDLGPDITACVNAVRTFDAGAGFASYLWQDGSSNQTYTAYAAGTYWVTVRDSCGGLQQDTVWVLTAPTPTLDLGADHLICAGDTTQLAYTSNGVFTTFHWSPATGLSCALCPAPWAAPLTTTLYYLAASTADGCTNFDSITVVVKAFAAGTQTISQCGDEPFIYNGHAYTLAGTYLDTLSTSTGCDSVVTTVLTFVPLPTRAENVAFCAGESVVINGVTYSQSGTITDTLAATVGCDTIVTYMLMVLPQPTRTETITFCPGESVQIGGNTYTQPGTVVDTIAGTVGCDTIVTYTLQFLTPAPSTVTIKCPETVSIGVGAGAGPTVVTYDLPTATSDCPCPGIGLTLTAGLASGSTFLPGTTEVCYTARDSCGHTASCCFEVDIREEQACDIKEIGCMKYELLTITADAGQNYTYRIRVTNYCPNEMVYTAIQLPNGLTAIEPADQDIFEAESGRTYATRNPNYSPFYSVRFKSIATGILGGQSDILQYSLPAQTHPDYIHITTRLSIVDFYEAHLNTFNCPIGVTPEENKPARGRSVGIGKRLPLRLFPNPSAGELFVDLAGWSGEKVEMRVFNAQGQQIQRHSTVAGESPYLLRMPAGVVDGLYSVEVMTAKGEVETLRFVLQR